MSSTLNQWRCWVVFCVTEMCVFRLHQTGVPGFLTEMQKACSKYGNYCEKKWPLDAAWAHSTPPYREGGTGGVEDGVGCYFVLAARRWLRHDVHDSLTTRLLWNQFGFIVPYQSIQWRHSLSWAFLIKIQINEYIILLLLRQNNDLFKKNSWGSIF